MMTMIVQLCLLYMHVDGSDCCLIGIVLGVTVTMKKNFPNNNTIQYL